MFRTTPSNTDKMPTGIPYIIGNEAAERFSFYGMKTILAVFIANYLHLMGDSATDPISNAKASAWVHDFNFYVYLTPVIGALVADLFFGKYRIIMWLSVVYCLGHGVLALMGLTGDATTWLIAGLALIAVGSGGIKPCVSAHVGDQFGKNNQHLLTQIFNWFYFSINLGAFLSTLATPMLLKYYGPHLAFGIPGVLMAIATILFWLGRRKYVHVPARPKFILSELTKPGVISQILKLCGVFFFVSIFWALFDQTGTTWVFQAQDMDNHFLGMHILPSQLQAFNPIMILTLIPVCTFLIYPLINRIFPLTPLRKIGIGLLIMATSFGLITLIQSWIDSGQKPSIGWQVLAYLLLTTSEVMVSIVSLELAYTQAPKSLKSIMMSIWLLAVAFGNQIASQINRYIDIPNPIAHITTNQTHAGFDGKSDTLDDITIHTKNAKLDRFTHADSDTLETLAKHISSHIEQHHALPDQSTGSSILQQATDSFGNTIHYEILNSKTARLRSDGADKTTHTQWDNGIMIKINEKPDPKKRKTWLDTRREQLGLTPPSEQEFQLVTTTPFIGGSAHMTKLEGAAYFRFFTYLMLGTALIFIPFSLFYRYSQQELEEMEREEEDNEPLHAPPVD